MTLGAPSNDSLIPVLSGRPVSYLRCEVTAHVKGLWYRGAAEDTRGTEAGMGLL